VCAGEKVIGAAEFAADAKPHGLLHGRPVLSPYAHARILSIDAAAALEVEGVLAVLRLEDLPIKGTGGRANEPLADSEVVFAGQPVVLVVAETEAAAEDGAELVLVDYEQLEAVMDVVAAMEPDSPLSRVASGSIESDASMHGTVGEGAEVGEETLSANVVDRNRFEHGDAEVAFARCAAVVERSFRTASVHQASLEPQVAVAWPEGNGGVAVYTSTQGLFFVRAVLSDVLGLPLEKIRVEGATLGGGFGGKIGLIEPLVASAALAMGRPLRVAFSRMEEFTAANPAPAIQYELKVGAEHDGTLAALEARVIVDTGAFPDMAPTALAGPRVGGPYRWGAWAVSTYGVRTNRPGAGAYRGPTAPQATFALEQLVDELAEKLGMDPLELRLKNVPNPGDSRLDGTPWPQGGLREVLETAQEHPLWKRRADLPAGEGIGLAAGLFPGSKMGASANCRLDSDGGFTVVTGYIDMTGTDTAIAQVAAEVIGVSPDDIRVRMADTNSAPQAGLSGGSMVMYCLGNAVQLAAEDARRQVLHVAAMELEAEESDLVLRGGAVFPKGKPDRGISLAQLGAKLSGFASPYPPIEGHGSAMPPEIAPSAACAIVHARVDFDTGRVELVEYVAVQDVGRAINPALCEGQMRGGAVQAIGMALFEELNHDADGQLLSGSFMSYTLPRSDSVPEIECVIVEVPAPHGPLGARGIGESAVVPGAAAVANAISRAAGVRLQQLPMTPQRIWEALVRLALPEAA
jgi:CO/xanthine dehydrogenase Mo-binding subunit